MTINGRWRGRTPLVLEQMPVATYDIRVVQPDPFFDPRLPDRAAMTGIALDDVRAALRRQRFRLREATTDEGTFVYVDRHRYTKLATLFTHLGLVLFLVAAAAGAVVSASGVVDATVRA